MRVCTRTSSVSSSSARNGVGQITRNSKFDRYNFMRYFTSAVNFCQSTLHLLPFNCTILINNASFNVIAYRNNAPSFEMLVTVIMYGQLNHIMNHIISFTLCCIIYSMTLSCRSCLSPVTFSQRYKNDFLVLKLTQGPNLTVGYYRLFSCYTDNHLSGRINYMKHH